MLIFVCMSRWVYPMALHVQFRVNLTRVGGATLGVNNLCIPFHQCVHNPFQRVRMVLHPLGMHDLQ